MKCKNCVKEINNCDNCYKALNVGDFKIICDMTHGHHFCSRRCAYIKASFYYDDLKISEVMKKW